MPGFNRQQTLVGGLKHTSLKNVHTQSDVFAQNEYRNKPVPFNSKHSIPTFIHTPKNKQPNIEGVGRRSSVFTKANSNSMLTGGPESARPRQERVRRKSANDMSLLKNRPNQERERRKSHSQLQLELDDKALQFSNAPEDKKGRKLQSMLTKLSRLDSKQQTKKKSSRVKKDDRKIVNIQKLTEEFNDFDNKYEKCKQASIFGALSSSEKPEETYECDESTVPYLPLESEKSSKEATANVPNPIRRLMSPLAQSFKNVDMLITKSSRTLVRNSATQLLELEEEVNPNPEPLEDKGEFSFWSWQDSKNANNENGLTNRRTLFTRTSFTSCRF